MATFLPAAEYTRRLQHCSKSPSQRVRLHDIPSGAKEAEPIGEGGSHRKPAPNQVATLSQRFATPSRPVATLKTSPKTLCKKNLYPSAFSGASNPQRIVSPKCCQMLPAKPSDCARWAGCSATVFDPELRSKGAHWAAPPSLRLPAPGYSYLPVRTCPAKPLRRHSYGASATWRRRNVNAGGPRSTSRPSPATALAGLAGLSDVHSLRCFCFTALTSRAWPCGTSTPEARPC